MKILVTAASRHGATREIGEAIAARLVELGHDATTLRPAEVSDIECYDAVVLGSAVYAGRWLSEARDFADRRADELRPVPVWIFSSGPVGDPPVPTPPSEDAGPVAGELGAREARIFAGRLDYHTLGLGERLIVRAVRAKDGDYRDWDEIRAFADEIAASLVAAPA